MELLIVIGPLLILVGVVLIFIGRKSKNRTSVSASHNSVAVGRDNRGNISVSVASDVDKKRSSAVEVIGIVLSALGILVTVAEWVIRKP